MRVLVTGGAGFIGSHVCDLLVESGHEPVVFDNLDEQVHGKMKYGEWPSYLRSDIERVRGDIRNRSDLEPMVESADAIIHLAACVGVGQSAYDIAKYTDVNVTGTAILLELIDKVNPNLKKLIVAGSMSSYGEGLYIVPNIAKTVDVSVRPESQMSERDWNIYWNDQICEAQPTPESHRFDCQSMYAMTKRDQEEMAVLFGAQRGINVFVPRFFNVYGPRQSLGNPYTGVAAIFSSRISAEKAPLIYEDGSQSRDFIHVRDVADVVVKMVDAHVGSGIFNVGTGVQTSIRQLADLLLDHYGATNLGVEIKGQYRKGDIRHCYADTSKLDDFYQSHFGIDRKTISLQEGILELVSWVNSSQDEAQKADHDAAHRELVEHGMLV